MLGNKEKTTQAYKHWTPEEDAILTEHWGEKSGDWEGWKELLPDRSVIKRRNRAKALGLRSASRAPWTPEEDAALVTFIPDHGFNPDFWAAKLPNRTIGAITNRAYKKRISARKSSSIPWSAKQRRVLKEGLAAIAHDTDRTVGECIMESNRLLSRGQIK